jgi:DNA-binding beta-propeller fold protein YncE
MERIDCRGKRLAARISGDWQVFGTCAVGVFILSAPLLLGRNARPVVSHGNVVAMQPARLGSVERWVQPQSGWLYVLDYNGMSDTSQILLVNPAQGATVGVMPAGYAPDMALSPDGKRLYIASGAPGSISVLNTESGTIETQFPAVDRLVQLGASFQGMTVSPNNRWLFIMETKGAPPAPVTYELAVYDTLHDNAPVGKTPLAGCGVGRLAWIGENKLLVHCYDANSISVLTLDGAGHVTAVTPPLMLPGRTGRAVNVSVLSDGESAVVFKGTAAVSGLNIVTQQALPKTAEPKTEERWTSAEDWPRSADGRKIYIGTGPIASRNTRAADEIEVFDTMVWQYTETIKTSVPFFSLALSKDGRYLYGISSSKRKILIINTLLSAEVGIIELPAREPTLAIVAP